MSLINSLLSIVKSWFGIAEHDVSGIVAGIENTIVKLYQAEAHHAERAAEASAAHLKALTDRDRAGAVADKLNALIS